VIVRDVDINTGRYK